MNNLYLHVEAIIFSSTEPVAPADICVALNKILEEDIKEKEIEEVLTALTSKYMSDEYSFSLEHTGSGYIFMSKPQYNEVLTHYLKHNAKKKLSNSAMETLSIIAYEQPVVKSKMEYIRGVNCDYSVQKLLDKGLVEIIGRADDIGKPLLYGTTKKFMEYLGINDINELPKVDDIHDDVNEIGTHIESEYSDA